MKQVTWKQLQKKKDHSKLVLAIVIMSFNFLLLAKAYMGM